MCAQFQNDSDLQNSFSCESTQSCVWMVDINVPPPSGKECRAVEDLFGVSVSVWLGPLLLRKIFTVILPY